MKAKNDYDLIVVGDSPVDVILDYVPPINRPGGVNYSAIAATARNAKVGIISDVGVDKLAGLLNEIVKLGINIEGIEILNAEDIRYEIRYSDETIPQLVTQFGTRFRAKRSTSYPDSYSNTNCLLIYPYQQEVINAITNEVRSRGGKIFFDLQHDVTDLDDWKKIISLCDVVFASRSELLLITGEDAEKKAVHKLMGFGVDNIVVKYGMGGSAIYQKDSPPYHIPAYLASFKCTIGAGDVYNAIFALEYSSGATPSDAGTRASLAASVFVERVRLHDYYEALSKLDFATEALRRNQAIAPPSKLSRYSIYIAGHFLSVPMRQWVDVVTAALESRGFSVFSPYRNVGILKSTSEPLVRSDYFKADLKGLNNADFVVALLDGPGRGGTSWEMGYAYSKGISILGLLTDSGRPLSNMVEQSCDIIINSLRALLNELYLRVSEDTEGSKRDG